MNKKSLENLRPGQSPGRVTDYRGERKKERHPVLTDTGWAGLRDLADERGLSRSELLEQIGRGVIELD